MSLNKEKLYTLRWAAGEIYKKAIDERTKSLSFTQIEVSSDLLGEPIPEEFRTPEPPRDSPSDETHMPKPISPIGEKSLWYPKAVVRKDLKMKAIGNYAKGYPQGAVIHFTAGQWDKGIDSAVDSISWGRVQDYLFFNNFLKSSIPIDSAPPGSFLRQYPSPFVPDISQCPKT